MTQNQDDEDSDPKICTRAEAIQQRKESIAEPREGDKRERRLAEVLSQCRKGNRCNRDECPVCERRQELAARRIPESVVESISGGFIPRFIVREIDVDAVKVVGKRRPLNERKVRAIAASINKIGLRTPITVRTKKNTVILVSGLHRLEAARRLRWSAIPCFTIGDDKIEARLWEIAENLYRAELTVSSVPNTSTSCARSFGRIPRWGRLHHPGGQQPKDTGINKTAKTLGLTKEEIRRSKRIAKISTEAKAEARKLGLDDNQGALLHIAKLPTSKAQLMAIREIDERKRATRARHASVAAVGDKKAVAKIKTIETTITQKMDTVGRLNDEVAAERKRLRKLQEKLVADCVDITLNDATTTSPPKAPTDDQDIPPGDDQRLLSPEDEASFAAVTAAWDDARELKDALAKASEAVHKRFIQKVRRFLRVH